MLNLILPLALLAIICPSPLHALAIRSQRGTSYTLGEPLPNPLTDPFYDVPSDVSSYAPGQVIRSRPVLTLVTGASVESYQVLYRTTNQQDQATATVGTMFAPKIPTQPIKVFSYQNAEDSVSLACTVSWSYVNGSSPDASNTLQDGFVVEWALAQGYYVVSTDFEGPTQAYLVGLIEARSVLDGIRATSQYFGFSNATFEVGLLGYSGAAHATVWACSQAAAYAPELKVVGAAYGGTPIDPLDTYKLVNGGEFAGEALLSFVGNARGVPKVNDTLFPLLTTKGKAIWQEVQAPDWCFFVNGTAVAGVNVTDLFTKDIFEIPYVQHTIAEQSLLANKSPLPVPVPTFPRLEWHGLNDTNVPWQPEVEYVHQQCAKGADIRLGLFPGLNHVPNEFNGLPGALLFLQQAFEGSLVKGKCGSNTTFPEIGSTAAVELLGYDANAALATLFAEAVKAAEEAAM